MPVIKLINNRVYWQVNLQKTRKAVFLPITKGYIDVYLLVATDATHITHNIVEIFKRSSKYSNNMQHVLTIFLKHLEENIIY